MSAQPLVGDVVLPCSCARAADALRRFVRDAPRIAIRARFAVPRLGAEIEAIHDVIVDLVPAGDGTVAVAWHGAGETPFPDFAGTLRVVGAGERARIRLAGRYDERGANPRDPHSGVAFRLAQAACRSTLASIARGVLDVR